MQAGDGFHSLYGLALRRRLRDGRDHAEGDVAVRKSAAIEIELERLSDQESELAAELEAINSHNGDDGAEISSLKMQIQALLESVRRQKAALLGRGLSPEQGEELVVESIK